MPSPTRIQSLPGIKRDGTQFEGDYYTDGRWVRFQRGLPRKMAGYRTVTSRLQEKVYGMGSFSASGHNYIHCGEGSFLEQAVINSNGILSNIYNRTPAGFDIDPENLWQFANLPDAVATVTDVIAHAAPNLSDISSTIETPIYYGQADDTASLVPSGLDPVSGGACTLGPYLFGYGNSGVIQWSAPNDPTSPDNSSRVTGQKIIRGMELRGGADGPAGIFWSLDSLIAAQFTGGTVAFAFRTLASELSVLSSRSIIEYDGIYYWWNVDRPLMFNGVVREVPNMLNINFFLDNLNFEHRQKVFAYKVPRFGEIWWCFPFGDSTECNWAVVYNVRENTWYDTPLPSRGRTSGIFAQVYPRPFMTDAYETATGYSIWEHETGTDEIDGSLVNPVVSFFQTADISMLTTDSPADGTLEVAVVEPDFVQSGDMTVEVTGKANARAPEIVSSPKTFVEDTGNLDAANQLVRFREARRIMRFRFGSNAQGGDYQMGLCFAHVDRSDGRQTS
jgi:hypothetical protein